MYTLIHRLAVLVLATSLVFLCSTSTSVTADRPDTPASKDNCHTTTNKNKKKATMSSLNSEDHHSIEPASEHHSPAPSESSLQQKSSQHTQERQSQSQSQSQDEKECKSPAPSIPEEPQEPHADYIITLKKNTTPEQFEAYKQKLIQQGSVIKHEYNSIILKGFAVSLRPSLLQSFQQDPQVQDIEPDGKVHI